MSEAQEDFNAFDHWDCFGASFMLGVTPAVLNFVFNDKEIVSTAILGAVGVAISLVVLLLALITRWRFIGVVLNWVGAVLTTCYIAFAVYMWVEMASDTPDIEPTEAEQALAQHQG